MKERKVIANLTWRCDMRCPYCWLYGPDSTSEGLLETEKNKISIDDWIKGLNNLLPCTIDFCGGEPTLFGDDFVRIVESLNRNRYLWALTTNMGSDRALSSVINAYTANPGRFVMINCSFHGCGPDIDMFIQRLRQLEVAGIPVARIAVSFVMSKYWDYMAEIEKIVKTPYKVQPLSYRCVYQDRPTTMRSTCNASNVCLCINVDGRTWPCPMQMRSRRREDFPTGHILGDIDTSSTLENVCDLNCCKKERMDWNIVRWDAGDKKTTEEAKNDQAQDINA